MKKSLIALAVLAASGAAMAQSSVTLYGRLDASVGQTSTKVGSAAKSKQNGVSSSELNSTFWGLKGSEDLGGGLKAIFKLESRFQVDTGSAGSATSANTLFEREANVGIEGGFGTVKLGRSPSVFDDLQGTFNHSFGSNFKVAQSIANGTGVADFAGTLSNSIKFNSANYGGFSGALQYGFGENKETGTNAAGNATDVISLSVKYAAGPLVVGYAYQQEKQPQAVATTAQDKRKFNLLGASYDLGVAKLTADYATAQDVARKDKAYQLGAIVPMGAFAVAVGYDKEKSTGAGVAELEGSGYNLVGTYDLSKRTTLYAGYKAFKTEAGNVTVVETKTTSLQAGVRHTF